MKILLTVVFLVISTLGAWAVPPKPPKPCPCPSPITCPTPMMCTECPECEVCQDCPDCGECPVNLDQDVIRIPNFPVDGLPNAFFNRWSQVMEYMNLKYPCVWNITNYFSGTTNFGPDFDAIRNGWHYFIFPDISTLDLNCDKKWRSLCYTVPDDPLGGPFCYNEDDSWDTVVHRLAEHNIPYIFPCEPHHSNSPSPFFWYPIYIYSDADTWQKVKDYRDFCLRNVAACKMADF